MVLAYKPDICVDYARTRKVWVWSPCGRVCALSATRLNIPLKYPVPRGRLVRTSPSTFRGNHPRRREMPCFAGLHAYAQYVKKEGTRL